MKSFKFTVNKWFLKALGVSAVFMPTQAFAADDPTSLVTGLTNKLTNFFLVVTPSIATVALMSLGVMYKITNDSHKKSEYKSHMKSTGIITLLVMSASGIVNWLLS